MARIFVPKESFPGETRVAMSPEVSKKLRDLGCEVLIERGASDAAFFSEEDWKEAGAQVGDASSFWGTCDFIWTVRGVEEIFLKNVSAQTSIIGLLGGKGAASVFEKKNLRAFSLELLPRISRAQAMDVLSSQSTIAGYWSVLEAAHHCVRLFPLLMTAAGTVPPARVLVLGAGVAGLQAIATAKRLGALVFALDVRPAVREQVESLGAEFVTVEAQQSTEGAGGYAQEMGIDYQRKQAEVLAALLPKIDVVIGTALIPGKQAPQMISKELTDLLKPGSVVVDLAADAGGNCSLSRPCETFLTPKGVTIVGEGNAPRHLPRDASCLYARNLLSFFKLFWNSETKSLRSDLNDELLQATCISLPPKSSNS
jgi:NAD(P) transhydrogenase subunit alpha